MTELDIKSVLDRVEAKMQVVTKRTGKKIPYRTVNGRFDDMSGAGINWWTNGFWGGTMWQLYNLTGNEMYKETAVYVEEQLDRTLMDHEGMDHDSGFRWLPTAVADYKVTGSKKAYNRGRIAADNLAGRFNPAGNFIRAWNDNGDGSRAGWAIIDCMMNLPLLYWAYDVTKDARYLNIACAHADSTRVNFIREDGSVKHIVEYDPTTGTYIKNQGGQGYNEASSWTRGQAWGLYGFTLSYMHTKKEEYLETAKKIADYFISCIPENGLIPVDFRQPSDVDYEDGTAAAIAACGLIELSKITGDNSQKEAALKMLKALIDNRLDLTEGTDYLLTGCSEAYFRDTHNHSMNYADYYFIEALLKLQGKELFMW